MALCCLALIWVNDLQWLQESAVTNSGLESGPSVFINADFPDRCPLKGAITF